MTNDEKAIIFRLADGELGIRDTCIEIYRRCLQTGEDRMTPEMRFMSEIDHPVPDLALRSMARAELLEQ